MGSRRPRHVLSSHTYCEEATVVLALNEARPFQIDLAPSSLEQSHLLSVDRRCFALYRTEVFDNNGRKHCASMNGRAIKQNRRSDVLFTKMYIEMTFHEMARTNAQGGLPQSEKRKLLLGLQSGRSTV